MEKKCDDVANLLKVLGHPKRLMILCHLADEEMNVSELQEVCDISQSQLSQFLTSLTHQNIVAARKEGTFSYYSITNDDVKKIVKTLYKIFVN